MAISVTSNYDGDLFSAQILEQLVLGAQAIEKGSINVIEDVQDKVHMPRMSAKIDPIVDRVATPSTAGSIFTYDEATITPLDMMVYDELNPRDFESVWRPFQPVGALVDKELASPIQMALVSTLSKRVNEQIGKLIWQGDTTGAADVSYFDGYEKLLGASADSIKVPQTGAIDASNILARLEELLNAIPNAVFDDPNTIIHMSTADFRKYGAALRADTYKGENYYDAQKESFGGKTIRFYNGQSENTMIVAKATAGADSNLHMATHLAADADNVKIERLQANSELFFVKILLKAAVNVGWFEETVISISTPA